MIKRLTVKDIRSKNKINILTEINKNNGITRNDLAKLTNVSLMTITNVIDELLASKHIYEKKTKSSIGRTPSNLYMDDNCGVFITSDFTTTSYCEYTIYDIKKKVVFSDTYKYNIDIDYIGNVNEIMSAIKKTIEKFELTVIGIGIAVPGAYLEESDTVITSLIKEHQNIHFYKLFSEYFNCENILIGNEVYMGAKSEISMLPQDSSLFYIHIGEGVGGTYVNCGNIVKGIDLLAGDIGQTVIEFKGKETTVEELISIPSIEKHYKLNDKEISINDIVREYIKDDSQYDYMKEILKVISNQIYNIAWLFNPDYIVIGSTSNQLSRLIVDNASKIIEKRMNQAKTSHFINTTVIASTQNGTPALLGLLEEIINNYIINCA